LDLYSGKEDRVRKAIHALVDSWQKSGGKGNNLKLFWNGKMLGPAEVRRFAI
jgi:inositol-pentakisphosphate 2-kinase